MKAMIYGNGGGSAKVFAVIGVTYPEGSTATATDGTTTLSAPDTSGTWACVVPNAGTWTVECTDGTDTATETVTITAEGQVSTVTLNYTLYLYDKGNEYTSVTGGWVGDVTKTTTTMKVGKEIVTSGVATAKTVNLINFGGNKTLICHIVSAVYNGGNNDSRIEILDKSGTVIGSVYVSAPVTNKTVMIDVSNFSTTSGRIAIKAAGGNGWYNAITVDKIWFSKE